MGFYECGMESLDSIEEVMFWLTERLSASQAGFRFTELFSRGV
jgi:hypothetical protein